MPDHSHHSTFEICTICDDLKDPPGGPSATSHAQVCCRVFRVPIPAHEEDWSSCSSQQSQSTGGPDGRCKNCPARFSIQQQNGCTSQSSDPPPGHSILPQPGRETAQNVLEQPTLPRGVRKRPGHKKFVVEIRPPKFKKKLHFGTYKTEPEYLRAKDAMDFYMNQDNPLTYANSHFFFSQIPLAITFRDLDPSCKLEVQISPGGKVKPAHVFFANEVKRATNLVLKQHRPPHQRCIRGTSSQLDETRTHAGQNKVSGLQDFSLIDPSSIYVSPSLTSTSPTDIIGESSSNLSDMISDCDQLDPEKSFPQLLLSEEKDTNSEMLVTFLSSDSDSTSGWGYDLSGPSGNSVRDSLSDENGAHMWFGEEYEEDDYMREALFAILYPSFEETAPIFNQETDEEVCFAFS